MYFQFLLLIKEFFSAVFPTVSSMNDLLMATPHKPFPTVVRSVLLTSSSINGVFALHWLISIFPCFFFRCTFFSSKNITFKVLYFINVISWSVGISLYHAVFLKNIMPRSLILGYHLFLRIWGKFYLSPLRVWKGLAPTKWWFDHKHTWDLRTRHDTYPQTALLLWVIDRIQIGQIFALFILRDTQSIADWRTAGGRYQWARAGPAAQWVGDEVCSRCLTLTSQTG